MGESTVLQSHDIITIARHFRLQWEEAQQAYVLLYPEGMVTLNESAGEILNRCQYETSVADIVTELQQEFEDDSIAADVREFLEAAYANGWISAKRPG